MEEGLVSVVTPCYNTAHLLPRLLDSLLLQDYPKVEFFLVDDGSKDDIATVADRYVPLFQKKGYAFHFIRQFNQGQSAALNHAIKLVNGEYLTWPDSDDWYRTLNALSAFVNKFEELPDSYGMVRCLPVYVDENTSKERTLLLTDKLKKEYVFENCCFSENFVWGAGNYMIRVSAFDRVNPTREIYVEKNAGQNWQMLLPLTYSYKCFTLGESYFNVLKRASSHSRGQYKTFDQLMQRISSYENTVLYTIENMCMMPDDIKLSYQKRVKLGYVKIRLRICIYKYKYKESREYKRLLDAAGIRLDKITLMLYRSMIIPGLWPLLHILYRMYSRLSQIHL